MSGARCLNIDDSPYRIAFVRSARQDLERLPRQVAMRVLSRIEDLAHDPRPRNSRKLRGQDAFWRIRVGDYRDVYDVSDTNRSVEIMVVRHRSAAYR